MMHRGSEVLRLGSLTKEDGEMCGNPFSYLLRSRGRKKRVNSCLFQSSIQVCFGNPRIP